MTCALYPAQFCEHESPFKKRTWDPLYLLSNVREIDHYGTEGLMIEAGVTLNGYTHLHVFGRGTMTSVRYRNEISQPYVRL
ncbi:hypothetical protein TNCV_3711 [Trichonephila clavipes]|nr:hypothetical protein TNCV_3711 [Trichonephila clavipes]